MADADIRQRMDHRRREQFEKFTRALAEVVLAALIKNVQIIATNLDGKSFCVP